MLEVFQGVSVGINTLVLIILVFKYLQDMRRQRLDIEQQRLAMEKLRYELERMQAEVRNKQSELVRATEDDIRKYVMEPLADEIRKASLHLREAADDSARHLDEIRKASLHLREAADDSARHLNQLVSAIAADPAQHREHRERIERAQLDVMAAIHGDLERLTAVLAPLQKLAAGLRGALEGMEAPSNNALQRTRPGETEPRR